MNQIWYILLLSVRKGSSKMIDYKRIQELDLRYDEIISGANLELRQITEEEGEELDAIKRELREIDKFGISISIIEDYEY